MGRDVQYKPQEFREAVFLNHATTTLAGALTLTVSSPQVQFLDPGGADRTVTLPAVGGSDGLMFHIANKADALELLNIKNAGATIQKAIGPGQSVTVISDGATWTIPGNIALTANIETLAGTHVLVATSPRIQTLDPGGAGRDVTLPAAAVGVAGLEFRINNAADAAEALTVKDAGATIIAIAQNEVGHVWCDGTTWYGGVMATT